MSVVAVPSRAKAVFWSVTRDGEILRCSLERRPDGLFVQVVHGDRVAREQEASVERVVMLQEQWLNDYLSDGWHRT